MAVTLTESAARHVAGMLEKRGHGVGLRVGTRKSGCTGFAYDVDYAEASVTVFGEWERLPVGGVTLPTGLYEADFVLTEESFHGSGLAGGWAAAMGVRIGFEIVAPGR